MVDTVIAIILMETSMVGRGGVGTNGSILGLESSLQSDFPPNSDDIYQVFFQT